MNHENNQLLFNNDKEHMLQPLETTGTKSKTHQPIQKFDITFFSGGNLQPLQLKCPNYKRKGAQQSSKNI